MNNISKAWDDTLLHLSVAAQPTHAIVRGLCAMSFEEGVLTIHTSYPKEVAGIERECKTILRSASYYFEGIKSIRVTTDEPEDTDQPAPAPLADLETPEGVWQAVLAHLQAEMPKASFDTWMRDTQVISFAGRKMVVGARNAYAREWLESRMAGTISNLVSGLAGRKISVEIVVMADDSFIAEKLITDTEEEQENEGGLEIEIADAVTRYAEEVQPDRIVAPYAYAFRLVHFGEITPKQFFLWLGFRQAVYSRWKKGQGTVKNIPWHEVCRFANMKRASFFAEIKSLAMPGLVQKIEVDAKKRHFRDKQGKLRQRANLYRIYMHPPLAKADTVALLAELKKRAGILDTTPPEERVPLTTNALISLLQKTPGDYLAQLPDGDDPLPEITDYPGLTVMDAVHCLTGIEGELPETLQKAAEKLHEKIISAFGTAQITHYFLEKAAPMLGLTHAQAILVVQLRDRCYLDRDSGELRDWVVVPGGYRTLSRWAGVSPKRKTVYEWLRDTQLGNFIIEAKPDLNEPEIAEYGLQDAAERLVNGWQETGTRIFSIRMDEPTELGEYGSQTPVGTEVRLSRYGSQTVSEYGNQTPVGTEVRLSWYGNQTHFKLFKALKPALKTHKSTTTAKSSAQGSKGVAVPDKWVLQELFQNARVSATKQRQLAGAKAEAFVSHLLYAYSQPSLNHSKIGYALEQLALDKQSGAGGVYDDLAHYPPRSLIQLALKTKMNHRRNYAMVFDQVDDPLWTSVMGEVNPAVAELYYVLTGSEHPNASRSETIIETIEFLD